MGKANFLHHSSGRNIACSVKRRVYNGDLILHPVNGPLVHHLGFHLSYVFVVYFLSYHLILAGSDGRRFICSLYFGQILNSQNLLGYALVMRGRKLCAILPIYLVAVVFRRIMTGCDIDSRNASQLPHCVGQLRSRTQRLKLVGLDAVSRQGHSCFHSKFR